MADGNGNCILYELLVLSEWIEDYDSVISKNVLNSSARESSSYFNPWKFLKKSRLINLRFLETEYPWHLAVSKDGKVIAVLQESLLEIRTAKDEFSSVVGKACVPNDQCPKLRKLCWSPDNSFLAFARDNGTVYVFNLFGCIIATVEPSENNGTSEAVAGLCFLQTKFDSSKWSNELLIVYHKGDVKSILISHLDGYESDENIKYSLENYYPEGILAVAYGSHHYVVIAGPPNGNEHGITIWRVLNDHPYFKITIDSKKSTSSSRSFLKLLPGFSNQRSPKTILKMQISPDEKLLACLHLSGEISIWRFPGLLLHKKWSLQEQPQYDSCNPQKSDNFKSHQSFYPVDISWWSNDALVIARKNGALSVCSTTTLENLLGDSPEFFASSPQISSIIGDRAGVIALECEATCNLTRVGENDENFSDKESETSALQASIKAAIYSFTDIEMFEPKRKTPKLKQRTYRLLALKRTTPEELYARKIDHEEYEEALLLANKYNLDGDLVYQKRWRNSQVSKESINNYLDKVKKIHWVVKECLERVPENLEDAKELLEFGLKKTELLKNTMLSTLTAQQRQLVLCRRQLFRFLDNLTIYEKMIGSSSKYSSIEYNNFRRIPAIVATVNFARQENWQAVSIMFTYLGNKVLPHWLPILSNFPETLRPLMYRSLLPEVVANEVIPWEVKKLRDADWVEDSCFEILSPDENDNGEKILYREDVHLKEFQCEKMTADIVEKWYKKRTYELENKSGLVENALAFVILAKERGARNLSELHNNLLTLESLVYLVGDDSITLTKLEALSHLEQCKLLLSKTLKETFIDDLKNLIVPFSKRCKQQNCDSVYFLLQNILLHFSEESLELLLELLNYLKEGYLNPLMLSLNEMATIALDCIYSCPKDNQLETCFLILECLPQRESSNITEDAELHDRIDRLELHLELCEILDRYKTPKSVRYIYENENNIKVGKELMENMADYTKRESLDFTELLSDLQFLQSKIFTSIPDSFCYELCALSQMSCECEEIIQSAEDIIECRKGDKDKIIPFEKSVELVLQAAKSHFERATNFDDYCIQLAQSCLKLIGEPHPQIYEELDLIEAVQLLGDFSVNILPLQVRKYERRIELIESCLRARRKNYKACQRLLQLAQNLRIYGDDKLKREGEVLVLVAEYALSSSDYQYCSEICHRLVTRNFPPAWKTIRRLVEANEYENKSNKKLFLAFAILHCPVENLEELIEYRIELNPQYLK